MRNHSIVRQPNNDQYNRSNLTKRGSTLKEWIRDERVKVKNRDEKEMEQQ